MGVEMFLGMTYVDELSLGLGIGMANRGIGKNVKKSENPGSVEKACELYLKIADGIREKYDFFKDAETESGIYDVKLCAIKNREVWKDIQLLEYLVEKRWSPCLWHGLAKLYRMVGEESNDDLLKQTAVNAYRTAVSDPTAPLKFFHDYIKYLMELGREEMAKKEFVRYFTSNPDYEDFYHSNDLKKELNLTDFWI
ncbi:MAG: hypothetical protein V1870_00190 [Candidatus Aenigmatarchaeota archaeon]